MNENEYIKELNNDFEKVDFQKFLEICPDYAKNSDEYLSLIRNNKELHIFLQKYSREILFFKCINIKKLNELL